MSERMAGHYRLMVEQVFEDILPEDLSLEQVPARHVIEQGEGSEYIRRVLNLEGSVIRGKDTKIMAILFTVNDITSLEAAETENKKNSALYQQKCTLH